MADPFNNARAYYDVTVPSSGDGFQIISQLKNALQGLGFMDMIPLQPRAHSPADTKIMVRGRDASTFYNPGYYNDANARIPFASGDSPTFNAPVSNPRIDIVYVTPSGDIRIQQGTEAATPTLPTLSPSGDTRMPVCAVWNKPGQARIVNFENKDSSTGDGYIYQDLRPFLQQPKPGGASFGSATPISPTGDAQAGPGTSTLAARADHVHGGVHGIRVVGNSNIQGDVEFAGPGGMITQGGNRITFANAVVQSVYTQIQTFSTGTTNMPYDDTPPQNNEGDLYLTRTITPKNAANYLRIRCSMQLNASGATVVVGLFQDAIASALCGVYWEPVTSGNFNMNLVFIFTMLAATTAQISFTVRAGSTATLTVNGRAGGRELGGVSISSIEIEEIAQ